MRKRNLRILIHMLTLTATIGTCLYGYHSRKNLDNIPSLELMISYLPENGAAYASEKI